MVYRILLRCTAGAAAKPVQQALRHGQTQPALQCLAASLALCVTPSAYSSCAAAQHAQNCKPCLGAFTLVHYHAANCCSRQLSDSGHLVYFELSPLSHHTNLVTSERPTIRAAHLPFAGLLSQRSPLLLLRPQLGGAAGSGLLHSPPQAPHLSCTLGSLLGC